MKAKLKDVEWDELGTKFWEPQKIEDEIIGVITEMIEGKHGMMYVILTATDEKLLTPAHNILQDRMKEVVVGDLVKIIYKGEKDTGKGNPAQVYKVYRAKTK